MQDPDRICIKILTAAVLFMLLYSLPVPAQSIGLSVSGTIADMQLTPGTTNQDSSISLTVTTDAGNWSVTASDPLVGKPTGTGGYMTEYNDTDARYIAAPAFKVLSDPFGMNTSPDPDPGITGYNGTPGAGTLLVYSGSKSPGTVTLPIIFSQAVTLTDPRLTNGNKYRIDILFTGTVLE